MKEDHFHVTVETFICCRYNVENYEITIYANDTGFTYKSIGHYATTPATLKQGNIHDHVAKFETVLTQTRLLHLGDMICPWWHRSTLVA